MVLPSVRARLMEVVEDYHWMEGVRGETQDLIRTFWHHNHLRTAIPGFEITGRR